MKKMDGINLENVKTCNAYFKVGENTMEIVEAYIYEREIFLAFFGEKKGNRYLQKFEIPQDIHLLKSLALALELKNLKNVTEEDFYGKKVFGTYLSNHQGFSEFRKYVEPPPPTPKKIETEEERLKRLGPWGKGILKG